MNDKQIICLLKAEIQDLEDQLADRRLPSVECMDDLNLSKIKERVVREAVSRCPLQKDAAALLGVDRSTLVNLVRKYNIKVNWLPGGVGGYRRLGTFSASA